VHRIASDFGEDCQGSVETFHRIKRLIESRDAGAAVGVRLDIGSGSVAIPIVSNRMLVLCSSAESLRLPDCIEVISAQDFRFCSNFHEIIAYLQREIDGLCECQKLGRVELSRPVEAIRSGAFSTDEDGSAASAGRFS
jgi:hypothetical protein